jgi:hypothetical protein
MMMKMMVKMKMMMQVEQDMEQANMQLVHHQHMLQIMMMNEWLRIHDLSSHVVVVVVVVMNQ